MKAAWIAAAAIGVAAVAAGAAEYASIRNRLERQTEAIHAQWLNVEAAIRERAGLIPEFVETVKPVVKDKSGDLQAITDARANLNAGGTPQETMRAYGRLDRSFARLLAQSGKYPKLRIDGEFRRLLDEIADSENRVAVERQKYNQALENYNASLQVFPTNMVAAISGFARDDAYFRPNLR